jgi:hypothetical protein
MEANVYWNHAASAPDEDGIAWVGAAGPSGSVAVGGGGYASMNISGADTLAYLPIIATKPDSVPEAWLFGVACPPTASGAPVKIHCFVVCLEGMPS